MISLALQAALAFGVAKTGVASIVNSIVATDKTKSNLLIRPFLIGKNAAYAVFSLINKTTMILGGLLTRSR